MRRIRGALLAAAVLWAAVACSSSTANKGPAPTSAAPYSGASSTTAPSSTAWSTTTATVPVVAATWDVVSSFYVAPSPLPPGPPGTILRAEVVTGVVGVPAGATVYRILYKSHSIYDTDIAVSGYVIVPPGTAPAGGRPVLSWAHGTTGITPSCFPSLFDGGGIHDYLLPGLSAFLGAGYVVAATDYEGIGGLEPYLLGASEGRGVLDAARAAHLLPGVAVSATTLIYGHSQGGHAALFAGELAPTYAPDLHVVGVAAAAPATDLSLILSLAPKTAIAGLLAFQVDAAWSWAQTYHDLPASGVFTARGVALSPGLVLGCLDDTSSRIDKQHLQGQDLFVAGLATDPVAVAHARLNDPGRVATTAPLLVVQGSADTTVPAGLTDTYVQIMACPVGDTIDYLRFTAATHGSIPFVGAQTVLTWMADRVAAHPAPSTCSLPGRMRTIP